MDLGGIGEADGDSCPYGDTAALYVPELVEQTVTVLDALEGRGVPSRFLLCGLCSGAYWGFRAALRDPRVASAFMINPRALYYDDWLEPERDARKARG